LIAPPRHAALNFPVAIAARLPRRPSTADANLPVPGRPPFLQVNSSDDMRGTLISKRRPGTAASNLGPSPHTRQISLAHVASNTSMEMGHRGPRPAPIQTNDHNFAGNQPTNILAASSLSPSFLTVSNDSPTSLPTPMDNPNFRTIHAVTFESESGHTEEEYHVLKREEATNLDPQVKPVQQKTGFWSKRPKTPADTDSKQPSPPMAAASSPKVTPPASSTSSSFARFLSRPQKDKRTHAVTEDDSSSLSGNTIANPADPNAAMAQIKTQIQELEEERKRLKKEARVRALLYQTGAPISMMGGMAM